LRKSYDKTFLVFPSLINEKRPRVEEIETFYDVSYHVSGAVENVYPSLVVLLGYTNTFSRTHQWQNRAQYELSQGEVCGFEQVSEREGEVELVIYYAKNTPDSVRNLFRGLFERFLSRRRNLSVKRYTPVICPSCAERQERNVIIRHLQLKRHSIYCSSCGQKLFLPNAEDLELS